MKTHVTGICAACIVLAVAVINLRQPAGGPARSVAKGDEARQQRPGKAAVRKTGANGEEHASPAADLERAGGAAKAASVYAGRDAERRRASSVPTPSRWHPIVMDPAPASGRNVSRVGGEVSLRGGGEWMQGDPVRPDGTHGFVAATPGLPASFAEIKDSPLVPEERLEEIDRMAEDFATRMEKENLETTDPLYMERWIEAREDSDLRFRLRFGKQAWLQHHIEAHHQALEAGGP